MELGLGGRSTPRRRTVRGLDDQLSLLGWGDLIGKWRGIIDRRLRRQLMGREQAVLGVGMGVGWRRWIRRRTVLGIGHRL